MQFQTFIKILREERDLRANAVANAATRSWPMADSIDRYAVFEGIYQLALANVDLFLDKICEVRDPDLKSSEDE